MYISYEKYIACARGWELFRKMCAAFYEESNAVNDIIAARIDFRFN